MAGHDSAADAGQQGYGARRAWLLPAATFLAGCALGGTLVAVGDVGDDDPAGAPASVASAADPERPGEDAGQSGEGQSGEGEAGDGEAGDGEAGDGDPGLYVRVPESCVQTADDATTLVEHVDRVVAAVAELEPERLRQTVDDVQQVRERVRTVADQCREQAAQRLEDAASAEATSAP